MENKNEQTISCGNQTVLDQLETLVREAFAGLKPNTILKIFIDKRKDSKALEYFLSFFGLHITDQPIEATKLAALYARRYNTARLHVLLDNGQDSYKLKIKLFQEKPKNNTDPKQGKEVDLLKKQMKEQQKQMAEQTKMIQKLLENQTKLVEKNSHNSSQVSQKEDDNLFQDSDVEEEKLLAGVEGVEEVVEDQDSNVEVQDNLRGSVRGRVVNRGRGGYQNGRKNCDFGAGCTKADCGYVHPEDRNQPNERSAVRGRGAVQGNIMIGSRGRGGKQNDTRECRNGTECKREGCTFAHPNKE